VLVHPHPPLPFSVGSDSCTLALTGKCTTDAVQVDWDLKLTSIPPMKGASLAPGRCWEMGGDMAFTIVGTFLGPSQCMHYKVRLHDGRRSSGVRDK